MSKYRNVKKDGFASKREAKRYAELVLREKAGEIRHLRCQVKYILIPKHPLERECCYYADFVYEDKPEIGDWIEVVEDCKGMRTAAYVIKRKLMLHVHGIRIRET
jgi:hypothetical protein